MNSKLKNIFKNYTSNEILQTLAALKTKMGDSQNEEHKAPKFAPMFEKFNVVIKAFYYESNEECTIITISKTEIKIDG